MFAFHANQRRRIAWLALFAVLATVLLPALSHALAPARGGGTWVEICTPQGMRLVAVSTETGESTHAPVRAAAHLEHCPYCAQSTGTLGMPAAPLGVFRLPGASVEVAARRLQAPHTPHAWRSAQPRAPPIQA